VAELVDDQILVERWTLQQDEVPRRVPPEAAEARNAKQPGRDDDADTAQVDRSRVEVETIEPRLRAFELGPQKTKMMSRIKMRIAAPTLMYMRSPWFA
jgi:hypothetical protein